MRSGQSLTLILPTPYTLKTSAGSCWLFCQFVLFETSMLQFINHIITHNAVIWYRTLLKNRRKLFLDKPPVTVAAAGSSTAIPPLYTHKTQFLNINLVCTLVLLSQTTTPHNWKLPKSSRTLFFVTADSDQVCQLSFYFCNSILLLLTLFPYSYLFQLWNSSTALYCPFFLPSLVRGI